MNGSNGLIYKWKYHLKNRPQSDDTLTVLKPFEIKYKGQMISDLKKQTHFLYLSFPSFSACIRYDIKPLSILDVRYRSSHKHDELS